MRTLAIALAASLLATPAAAEVVESDHGGFASTHSVVVDADRQAVWRELVHPETWWSHTWSDNPANLRLDVRAGGCFCETIPAANGWSAGSVEHMRVIAVFPGTMLRMSGSLGPLQAEGMVGTLTVTLADEDVGGGEGTRITWDYITGGEAHYPPGSLANIVDSVQAEFLGGLVGRLGGAVEMPVESD